MISISRRKRPTPAWMINKKNRKQRERYTCRRCIVLFLWTGSGDYHDFFGTAGIPCRSDRIPAIHEGKSTGDCKKTKDTDLKRIVGEWGELAKNRDELTKVIGNKYCFCGKLHKILYQFGEICYNIYIDEVPCEGEKEILSAG